MIKQIEEAIKEQEAIGDSDAKFRIKLLKRALKQAQEAKANYDKAFAC